MRTGETLDCEYCGSPNHYSSSCPDREEEIDRRERASEDRRRQEFEAIRCPTCGARGHGTGPCPNSRFLE